MCERNKFEFSLANLQSPIVSFGPRFRFPYATLHHLDCTSKANKSKALVQPKIGNQKNLWLRSGDINCQSSETKTMSNMEIKWYGRNKYFLPNTLISNINMHLLHTVLHTFLMVLLKRICSNVTTLISSLVIMSVILMTYLFDQAVLMLGEIGCGSLSGLTLLRTVKVE